MSEKTLVKKLVKVMKEVQYIEKRGFNKFNNYKYATESDVAEKVREVLAEQNVIMLPDVTEHTTREHVNRKGNTEYIATVKVKFTFIDGDSGEELSIHSAGEGQDAGDKAVYKAITGAQKYALMKAFMIPTGDDPEADDGVDKRNDGQTQRRQQEPITQEQLGNIKVKALKFAEANNGSVDVVYEALKITDLTTLTKSQADAALKQLDAWISETYKGDKS
ncbi:ERF family protein [Virgibacillus dakarensis]|nr:ERF family protein [Virgibacillus dakarensis]MBT2215943.1 ERF family protein [Virgibacillus dakarensis]